MTEVEQLLVCLRAGANKLTQQKRNKKRNLPLFGKCPFSQVIPNTSERDHKCITHREAKISEVV